MQNFFHAFKNRDATFKIAFTGIMLGMVLLFQYLEHFMPFAGTYMKLNLSLLFILPVFYFAGPSYGMSVILTRFLLAPAFSSLGYSVAGIISQTILLICTIITIIIMYMFSAIFSKIQSHNIKIILISISTVILTSLILTILNGLLFTPLFWNTFKYIKHVSVKEAASIYDKTKFLHAFFFGIKTYWPAIFGTYMLGNLVKYSIVFIVYFPLSLVFRNYVFTENTYHNDKEEQITNLNDKDKIFK